MSNQEAYIRGIERAISVLAVPAALDHLEAAFVSELRLFSGVCARNIDDAATWADCLMGDELANAYTLAWRQGKREAWVSLCWIAKELHRLSGDTPVERDARMARLEQLAGGNAQEAAPSVRPVPCNSL